MGIPEALLAFVERFNRGEYWESHEVLEEPWRENRSDFYQGLILYASAFVHAQRKNSRGVVAQLRKAERHLAAYRPAYLGLNVAAILDHARQAGDRAVQANVDWEALFPPLLVPREEHVRGDEEELWLR